MKSERNEMIRMLDDLLARGNLEGVALDYLIERSLVADPAFIIGLLRWLDRDQASYRVQDFPWAFQLRKIWWAKVLRG